jgi:hypothetical protein
MKGIGIRAVFVTVGALVLGGLTVAAPAAGATPTCMGIGADVNRGGTGTDTCFSPKHAPGCEL